MSKETASTERKPIDHEKLRKVSETLDRLEKLGVTRKEYDLVPPYGTRIPPIKDTSGHNPKESPFKRKEYDLVPPFGGRRVHVVDADVPQKLPRGKMR